MYAPSPRDLPPMIRDHSESITLYQSSPTPDGLDIDMDFLAEFENSMDVVEDESDEEDGMEEVMIPSTIAQSGSTESLLEDDEIVEHSPITESFVTPAPVSQQGTDLPSDTPVETHEEALPSTRDLSKSQRRALATRAKKAAPPLPPVPAHLRSSHISALDVALGSRKQRDWMKTGQPTLLRDRETVPAPICQAPGRKRTRSITDRETAKSAKKPRTVSPCFIATAHQARPLFYSPAVHTAGPSTGNLTYNAPITSSSSNQSGNLPTPRPTYVDPYHRPIHDVAFTRTPLSLTDANFAAFRKKFKNLPADPKILAQALCADVPVITPDTTVICPQDHACVLLSDFERHAAQYHYHDTEHSFKCRCHGSKTVMFATASELVKHMRNSHLVETKFRCPHCPKLIVPVEKNMRDHLLRSCHGMETFE